MRWLTMLLTVGDAEIECSYGWIECVGIADRSAYDLKAHTEKCGVPLNAQEKFSEPREVEKLKITLQRRTWVLHSRVTKRRCLKLCS